MVARSPPDVLNARERQLERPRPIRILRLLFRGLDRECGTGGLDILKAAGRTGNLLLDSVLQDSSSRCGDFDRD